MFTKVTFAKSIVIFRIYIYISSTVMLVFMCFFFFFFFEVAYIERFYWKAPYFVHSKSPRLSQSKVHVHCTCMVAAINAFSILLSHLHVRPPLPHLLLGKRV